MTGRDVIKRALRLVGAVASNENPSASEIEDGRQAFNSLIDSWSNERLLINKITREVFKLNAGQGSYTFGPGGDFDSSRPISIFKAASGELRVETIEIPDIDPLEPSTYEYINHLDFEMPVKIDNDQEYLSLALKGSSSKYVTEIYIEAAAPLSTVKVYPVPSEDSAIAFYSFKPLQTIDDVDDELELPPGYQRAIEYNLAIEIAPEYGRAVSAEILKSANEAKASIKRTNFRPLYLTSDAISLINNKLTNIFTGGNK